MLFFIKKFLDEVVKSKFPTNSSKNVTEENQELMRKIEKLERQALVSLFVFKLCSFQRLLISYSRNENQSIKWKWIK